jgi:hypothetical protein
LKEPIDLKEKLKMINDYVVSLGSELSVFYIPSRNQVSTYYYKYEKEYCLIGCPDQLDLPALTGPGSELVCAALNRLAKPRPSGQALVTWMAPPG